ncbi:MAG: hypothetical protein MZV63_36055 [Marinilabiliales bacterium]|nr:hypothetical protein [Marinilabiliales bacterium]
MLHTSSGSIRKATTTKISACRSFRALMNAGVTKPFRLKYRQPVFEGILFTRVNGYLLTASGRFVRCCYHGSYHRIPASCSARRLATANSRCSHEHYPWQSSQSFSPFMGVL